MIIEFIGLPGSGKSLCDHLLTKELDARKVATVADANVTNEFIGQKICRRLGMSIGTRRHLFPRAVTSSLYQARVFSIALKNRATTGSLFAGYRRFQRLPHSWLAESMLLSDFFASGCFSEPNQCVYLTSEGVFHLLAAIMVWNKKSNSTLLDKWISRHAHSRIKTIRVSVPVEEAIERVWQRGIPRSWPVKQQSKSCVKTIIEDFHAAIESVTARMHGVIDLWEVDNSLGIDHLEPQISSLAECIDRSLDSSSARTNK